MHDAYQKDDIYNEAARRVGAGDIVLGKRTIRKNIEFTLSEIRTIKTPAVDVSSGVESQVGEKSHKLIEQFVEKTRIRG